jgi:hypothetical protein
MACVWGEGFAQVDLKTHRWLIVVSVAGLLALVFLTLSGHIRVEHPVLQ